MKQKTLKERKKPKPQKNKKDSKQQINKQTHKQRPIGKKKETNKQRQRKN